MKCAYRATENFGILVLIPAKKLSEEYLSRKSVILFLHSVLDKWTLSLIKRTIEGQLEFAFRVKWLVRGFISSVLVHMINTGYKG